MYEGLNNTNCWKEIVRFSIQRDTHRLCGHTWGWWARLSPPGRHTPLPPPKPSSHHPQAGSVRHEEHDACELHPVVITLDAVLMVVDAQPPVDHARHPPKGNDAPYAFCVESYMSKTPHLIQTSVQAATSKLSFAFVWLFMVGVGVTSLNAAYFF